jgi:zinc transporter
VDTIPPDRFRSLSFFPVDAVSRGWIFPAPTPSAEIPEDGLICGFEFPGDGRNRDLRASEIAAALSKPSSVVWLHVNVTPAGILRWLTRSEWIPENLRGAIEKHDERCRIEPGGDGLVVVVSDLTFEDDSDPSEVATLWAFATDRLLLTARKHPLKTADRVRAEVRAGLRADSATDLLAKLFGFRMETRHELVEEINEEVDEIEDQVLRGRVTEQREQLGRLRRDCARLRRSLSPDAPRCRRSLRCHGRCSATRYPAGSGR